MGAMMEQIAFSTVQNIDAGAQLQQNSLQPASPDSMLRFEQQMAIDDAGATQAVNLGSEIREAAMHLSAQINGSGKIAEILAKDDINVRDMMELQVNLIKFSTTTEFTSKAAGSVEQSVQKVVER